MQTVPYQLGKYTYVHVKCTTALQLSQMLLRLRTCVVLRPTMKVRAGQLRTFFSKLSLG